MAVCCVAALTIALAACSSGEEPEASVSSEITVSEPSGEDDSPFVSSERSSTPGPSTTGGRAGSSPGSSTTDPAAPTTVGPVVPTAGGGEVSPTTSDGSQPPPTTALVGDPAPNPSTTAPPQPSTIPPAEDACDRLDAAGVTDLVADIVSDATGATPTVEPDGSDICRYRAAPTLVEIHFVAQATVIDDWFRREGVEPVGEVGGNAVGLPSFVPPGSDQGAGYTIAVVGDGRGTIVAVTGIADERGVAAEIAVFANQVA